MKTKLLSLSLLIIFHSLLSYSQVTTAEKALRTQPVDSINGWKKGGLFVANLSQTSLTNWAAGGQSSIAVNGILSLFANLKQGKSYWDNSIDLGYGLLKQGKNEDFRKTDDKIELLSKYGRLAFGNFYYSVLFSFKTQMSPGYNYTDANTKTKISDFFAPAYLLIAAGLDYKPNEHFSAFLAPITARFTFVKDKTLSEQGAFGVSPGDESRTEIGGYFRGIFTKNDFTGELLKNVAFTTKIDLFSNYAKKPQNVDVNWETLIALKVNKYISVTFNTVLIYDDDIKIQADKNGDGIISEGEVIGSLTQFKEILGVGLSYKF